MVWPGGGFFFGAVGASFLGLLVFWGDAFVLKFCCLGVFGGRRKMNQSGLDTNLPFWSGFESCF